jgi:uncharacterized protein
MRYYTTGILSARLTTTPEGFLVCADVPIARTGTMLYADGEVPVPARDGLVRIQRTAEHVFSADTIASFEGKAITLDHPSVDVNPDNWAALAKGIVQNVRRGLGLDDEYLIGDLLITDRDAIRKVRDGLREVSCGYDADYETTSPGEGLQMNIIGNHLALVTKGRCGSRCAIGDSMKKVKFLDALRAAFKSRNEEEHEKVLTAAVRDSDEDEETEEEKKKRLAKEKADDKEDDKKTADALASLTTAIGLIGTRLTAVETKTKDADEETPEEKKKRLEKEKADKDEEDGKTSDSAKFADVVQDVRARAEILAPGIQLPTFDAALTPAKTQDALCQLKRLALTAAYMNPKTRDAVTPLVAGVDLSALTCDALSATFVGASELVRRDNNAQAAVTPTFDGLKTAQNTAISISDMNKKAAAFWSRS